jgi:hypothetical protein
MTPDLKKDLFLLFKVSVVMFNATFNNISVISWWSILLVEENGVCRENH